MFAPQDSDAEGMELPPAVEAQAQQITRARRRRSSNLHTASSAWLVETVSTSSMKRRPRVFPRNLIVLPKSQGVRHRSFLERAHLAFTSARESRFGGGLTLFTVAVVLLYSASFIAETLPSMLVYRNACKHCKPLPDSDLSNEELVAQRFALRDSCKNCEPSPRYSLKLVQMGCSSYFIFIFLVQLLTSPFAQTSQERVHGPLYEFETLRGLRRMWLFITRWHNLISFAANVSDIISLYVVIDTSRGNVNFAVIRLLSVVRVARLFSAGNFLRPTKTFVAVMRKSMRALLSLVVLTVFGTVICGTLAFFAEQGTWDPGSGFYKRSIEQQEDAVSPFLSIPHSCWWVFVTFTTVGYGDMYPVTPWGKVVGVGTIFLGVILVALPIAVISTNFVDVFVTEQQYTQRKRRVMMLRRRAVLTFLQHKTILPMRRAWNRWKEFVAETRAEETSVAKIISDVIKSSRYADFDDELGDLIETPRDGADGSSMMSSPPLVRRRRMIGRSVSFNGVIRKNTSISEQPSPQPFSLAAQLQTQDVQLQLQSQPQAQTGLQTQLQIPDLSPLVAMLANLQHEVKSLQTQIASQTKVINALRPLIDDTDPDAVALEKHLTKLDTAFD